MSSRIPAHLLQGSDASQQRQSTGRPQRRRNVELPSQFVPRYPRQNLYAPQQYYPTPQRYDPSQYFASLALANLSSQSLSIPDPQFQAHNLGIRPDDRGAGRVDFTQSFAAPGVLRNYESNFPAGTADQRDANWPIGYPALLTQEWTDQARRPSITVRKGTTVKVVAEDTPKHAIRVQLADQHGIAGADFWVPRSILKIGTWAKMGEYWVWVDVDVIRARNVQPTSTLFEGLLSQTVRKWLKILCMDFDRVHFAGAWLRAALDTSEKSDSIQQQMLYGIHLAGMMDLFDRRDFKVMDIRDRAPQQLTGDHGVYEIVASGGGLGNVVCMYTGKTGAETGSEGSSAQGGFSSRMTGHLHQCGMTVLDQAHKQMAKASSLRMVPISISRNPVVRSLTEQFFTSFLETYQPWLTAAEGSAQADFPRFHADFSKTSVFRSHALTLQDIAKEVTSETGFPGGTKRPTFGAGRGLNTKSPLTEGEYHTKVFVKTSSASVTIYRRAGETLGNTYRLGAVIGGISFTKFIPTEMRRSAACIQPGTPYDWFWELRQDGKPHPRRYYNLPEVGSFSDWSLALSLAGGFEWVQDNHRYRTYMQNPHKVGDNPLARVEDYKTAAAMIRLLKRETIEGESRPEYPDMGLGNVLEVTFSRLARCFRVKELRGREYVQVNRLTKTEVWEEFKKRGAGSRAASDHWPSPKCDACFLLKQDCKRVNTESCEHCEKLGWPSVFTAELQKSASLQDIPNLQPLIDGLCALPPQAGSFEIIDLGLESQLNIT